MNLDKIITYLDITPDEWVRPENIRTINLLSDGNFYYSKLSHRLFFDNTRRLIKVKEISSKAISAILPTATSIYNYKLVLPSLDRIPIYHKLKPFRNIQVGDTISFINNSTNEVIEDLTAIVDDIKFVDGRKEVYFLNPIIIPTIGVSIVYSDSQLLNKSVYEKRYRAFILYTELTQNVSDKYITYDSILSISLRE